MQVRFLSRMTHHAQLISVRIAEISAEVSRVIFGPQTGLTLGGTAVCHCYRMRFMNGCAAGCLKRNHLSVARQMRHAIERNTNQEQGLRATCGLPACPWPASIAEALFYAQ